MPWSHRRTNTDHLPRPNRYSNCLTQRWLFHKTSTSPSNISRLPPTCSIQREVFERVGPFNSRLKSNGDWEWGQRVFRNNIPQRFGDNVVIEHPARASLGALMVKAVRLAGGAVDVSTGVGLMQVPLDIHGELRIAAAIWIALARKCRRKLLSFTAILAFLTSVRIGEKIRLRAVEPLGALKPRLPLGH